MVDITVGAAAADGVCIDTPTPLSAKSNNKTGIQKGIFLIFYYLLFERDICPIYNRSYLAWLARIMLFAFPSKFI